MEILRAKTAGFCMGVSLALQKLDSALEQADGKRICTLGPIIHNPQVLADYETRGVFCASSPAELGPQDCVLIRGARHHPPGGGSRADVGSACAGRHLSQGEESPAGHPQRHGEPARSSCCSARPSIRR